MTRLLIIALFALGMFACDDTSAAEVPAAVTTAFETAYPGATDVEWEHEVDGNYQVEFDMNGEEMEVNYSPSGQVLDVDED